MTTFPSTNLHDVQHLLKAQRWAELRAVLAQWPDPELADLLAALNPVERVLVFRLLPRSISNTVFAYLNHDEQYELLSQLNNDETRQVLADLNPDDRTQLFEELPGQVTQKLLNLLGPEDLREARQLLGYPEESVGRLMTPDYIAIRPDWTVAQALEHIRSRGSDSETINLIYVTDANWRFLDALELRRFILADPQQPVEALMDNAYVVLSAFDDRERAVNAMRRYDLPALPVVDSDGILVGIVTFDDLFDVADEETTEDFHKGAAVAPLRGSYVETGVAELVRKRVPWLLALVFVNIFSGAAIAAYEDTIAAVVALVFFLPLLIDSSGNAGSQAATLTVRALAMGEVRARDWHRLLSKELIVSLLLGLAMAAAVALLAFFRAGPEVAMVVALTMSLVVIVGSSIGTILPLILQRIGFDPATASGPLITSLADITGVLIYFSLATWLLGLG
ncbi:magnesium transporter [Candidatus Viridilinea mediisalina]|uniref:Magnesium transporter MgtE n=1 Tax=Candidatus Viridilinea mediisalina TaxID=2024553 RepID=A0A2A6RLK6_9CHLR|nr:magnesium transporter [Candidatus Viridilinea mediisalina]PDW03947.1 magnesium transporter [Candidatus Viridilinea mediisalina]